MKLARPILAVLALLLLPAPASAKDGRGKSLERLVQDLGLSADQTARVQSLEQNRRQTLRPIRRQLRSLRAELRSLWSEVQPDRASILQKTREITALREKREFARIEFKLGVHALLSPEQRLLFHRSAPKRGRRVQRGR